MIVGITGGTCSGKHELVKYLVRKYNFEAVNVRQIFVMKLREIMRQRKNKKNIRITKSRS